MARSTPHGSSGRGNRWQANPEDAPGGRHIRHFDSPAVCLDGLLHDGEPEPQSAPIFPSLHVRFEQVLGRPFRQSIAPILELHERLIVVASASDDHAATGSRELYCVADQVRGHGMQQPPISFHNQLLVYVERDRDALVLCLGSISCIAWVSTSRITSRSMRS